MTRQPRSQRSQGRLLGAFISLAGHLLVVIALLWTWAEPPTIPEPAAVVVALIDEPSPTPKAAPKAAPAGSKSSSPAKSRPRHASAQPTHAQPVRSKPSHAPLHGASRPPEETEDAEPGTELSDAQIAGASVAGSASGSAYGSGSGGGVCDMAVRVQLALRKDPLVRAALAGSGGKASMVWNGDWVRGRGEDGKGLAAVREAIIWEIAFAPPACRAQSVRGLVMLSLNEAAGSARLAVGTGEWRWSDLLAPRR